MSNQTPKLLGPKDWEAICAAALVPSAAQIRAVVEDSLWLPPEGVSESIAELQATYEAELAQMLKFTPREATKAFANQAEKLIEGIAKGERITERDSWSRSDFEEDFALKLAGCKLALKRLAVQAFNIVKPLAKQFEADVMELAENCERGERESCEHYGFAFEPSKRLILFHKVRLTVKKQLESFNPGSGLPPRQIAAFIPLP
jgi:hypothetical protein